jgi:hypothetical protein
MDSPAVWLTKVSFVSWMASASALGVLARLILQYLNVEYVKPKPNSTNYERWSSLLGILDSPKRGVML